MTKKVTIQSLWKLTSKRWLHPFKNGFWCIMAIGKADFDKHLTFGMLWEEWDNYAGDGDYGFNYFWTGYRKTWKELKYYKKFGIEDDGYFQFIVPYFITWFLVLGGTLYHNYKRAKEYKDFVNYYNETR